MLIPFLLSAQVGMIVETGSSHVNGTSDEGYAWIGDNNAYHLSIDGKNIQAKQNAGAEGSPLQLNGFGGNVIFCDNTSNSIGRVGINRDSPSSKLQIVKSNSLTYNLAVEDDGSSVIWTMSIGHFVNGSTNAPGDALALHTNFNTLKGYFDAGNGNYYSTSDRRLKTQIKSLKEGALENLLLLEPSTYLYKSNQPKASRSYGYMAQDVEQIFPDVVLPPDKENPYYSLGYTKLGVFSVKALQELKEQSDENTSQLDNMSDELLEIQQQLQQLSKK